MTPRVLRMFEELGKPELDLHELFEAGGNDPEARRAVFYAVENLVERGLLEERGNDFYALTEAGRAEASKLNEGQPRGRDSLHRG
jgi:repressor of nif and glnA expression